MVTGIKGMLKMESKKERYKGVNGLSADYFWFSNQGEKDKKRGIQEMENWLAHVTPLVDFEEKLIRASFFEVLKYRCLTKPKTWWLSLNTNQKIAILAIAIPSSIAIVSLFLFKG